MRRRANSSRSTPEPGSAKPELNNGDLLVWTYEPLPDTKSGPYALVTQTIPDNDFTVNYPQTDDQQLSTEASAVSGTIAKSDLDVSSPPAERVVKRSALTPTRRPLNPDVARLVQELDAAVRTWQDQGELASPGLLRAGLTAVDSGVPLPQRHQSLLLRTALFYRRGMLTALSCQDDPERTAIILSEALTILKDPIAPPVVQELMAADPNGEDWRSPLLENLRIAASSANGRTKRRAIEALAVLQGLRDTREEQSASSFVRPWLVVAVSIVTIVIFSAMFWYRSSADSKSDMVTLPAGRYEILDASGAMKTVTTNGLVVSAHEITNQHYGRCVDQKDCTSPQSVSAGDIDSYYANPSYDNFPVVNVTQKQAQEYCTSQGMRLPSGIEWILTAVAAPETGVPLQYPWGSAFSVQQANVAESLFGAPLQVGSYSSGGDGPIGTADMAGNVAEWTSTTRNEGATYVVKGGSYQDTKEAALASAETDATPQFSADWLGFRCVSSP